MRVCVISKGLGFSDLQAEVQKYGGSNLKLAPRSKMLFADLDDEGMVGLGTIPGLAIKSIGKTSTKRTSVVTPPAPRLLGEPVYAASQAGLASGFYAIRHAFEPPLTGQKASAAVLDSGIRKTHEGLHNKVVHEANMTDSPTCDDIFDHGTAVAYIAMGGTPGIGEEQGICPEGYIMNIKVLGDDGSGTEEWAVMGVEYVIELKKRAEEAGLDYSDPMYPSGCICSWGTDDTGDPDQPIRAVLRAANKEGLYCFAAAGNSGPDAGSIMSPACEPLPVVTAVGCATLSPLGVANYSSRGPTKEGVVKPDMLFFGHRMVLASSKSDTAYEVKSGTSFSAPAASGILNLAAEMYERITGQMVTPSKESLDEIFRTMPQYTYHPPEQVGDKDNTYGYGIPAAELLLGEVKPGIDLGTIVGAMVPMMMIGIMAKIMK